LIIQKLLNAAYKGFVKHSTLTSKQFVFTVCRQVDRGSRERVSISLKARWFYSSYRKDRLHNSYSSTRKSWNPINNWDSTAGMSDILEQIALK